MKISKLFHWLYAAVMFLPLLVAPIFAIYTRNENATYAETIEVETNKVVDFNQYVINGKPNSLQHWTADYTPQISYSNNTIVVTESDNIVYCDFNNIDLSNHKILFKVTLYCDTTFGYDVYYNDSDLSVEESLEYTNTSTYYVYSHINDFTNIYNVNVYNVEIDLYDNESDIYIKNLQIFDLTKMFGFGNEPTIQQFDSWYPNEYYEYTTSRKELLKNYDSVIYNNTDIGSQFLYTMYITTDKYLNFDEVFNLGAISDWINLNVFNGNAPIIWSIIWHYLDYWLLLSIFWLCFDVLIYVPQLAHRWLDKASLE